MSIEATLRDLVGSTYAFNSLSEMKELRGKLSFKIARAIKAVQPELDTYNESAIVVRDKYHDKIETEVKTKPGEDPVEPRITYELKDDAEFKDYQKEMDELLDTSVTLSIEPLLTKPFDNLEISPGVLTGILWLFKD